MTTNKDKITQRIQNYLYSFYAKDINIARDNEIYDCLCMYIMEIVGKTWVDSKKIKNGYEVYLLSFEYLPGRFLPNIIYKLGIEDEIKESIEEMGFSYKTIMDFDPNPDLGIGDMGMGSTYLLNVLTNNKIKTTAYALRYEAGIFKQSIVDGMQMEESNSWLGSGSNWEHKKSFTQKIDIYGRDHQTVTYDMPVVSDDASFVNTLRLFKSDPTENVDIKDFSRGDIINAYDDYINNSSITKFLYVDDSTYEGKTLRLKQEYFYSASAMRDFVRRFILYYEDIRKIKDMTNVIINDIHPTLALIEFIRILKDEHDFSLKDAISYTREIFYHLVFSITDDSLERYPIDEIRNMNQDVFNTILDVQNELMNESGFMPFIENGFVIFKNINIALSRDYVFLSKTLFEDRKDEYKNISYMNLGSDKLIYGESANRDLYNLLNEIGANNILDDKDNLLKLKENTEFIDNLNNIKLKNKLKLIEYLKEYEKNINPYSIFDMQLSMMHESKRQILNALAIAYEYYYLRDNRNAYFIPKTYIFSGKANEGYFVAKEAIKFILALKKLVESDRVIKDKIKIIFVENLNVSSQRYLYPACDIYSNLTLPIYDNQNFDILNASYNMSNILTTKAGIANNLDTPNKFYLLGDDYSDYKDRRYNGLGNVNDVILSDEIVQYTTDNLLNESFERLPYDFKTLFNEIILYNDSFDVLRDLSELVEMRNHISNDYLNRDRWLSNEIYNIIWANGFNFDEIKKRK